MEWDRTTTYVSEFHLRQLGLVDLLCDLFYVRVQGRACVCCVSGCARIGDFVDSSWHERGWGKNFCFFCNVPSSEG
jgi:hypothetical protein